MRVEIPDFCLALLVGPSGSGKSRLAERLFKDEALSSDFFRKLVSGDEADQSASEDAFECLYLAAEKRLDRRKLTVIDATHLNKWARSKALDFAKKNNCFCYAIVLNIPEGDCQRNNALRPEKRFSRALIRRQHDEFKRALQAIKKEPFRRVFTINSLEEADSLEISRVPLWTDKSALNGPFDIIGDIHGCYSEACALLKKLGCAVDADHHTAIPPAGRTVVFLGDLCDRGPDSASVLKLVMNMAANGRALCVPGNHDDKLCRWLEGRKVQTGHGLESTIAELEREGPAFKKRVHEFLRGLVSHYLLDGGRLVASHAGLPEKLQGRSSQRVREFCLYGDPSGKLDEYGLPERNDWAADYSGKALAAYGHCPVLDARVVNNSVCLDTGCVFGGSLTALRYPEMETVSVPAQKEYFHPPKPLAAAAPGKALDARELLKRKRIETGLGIPVLRDKERALSALEIMGRFAVNPNWLIYLPPTMAPCGTSALPDYLEHPFEAFDYYKKHGLDKAICEEKHMGSRAIAIVCADEAAAARRFAASGKERGIIYTRTGRPFFSADQAGMRDELLGLISEALSNSGFWRDYATDWVCLDCELMPWSFKAGSLISGQYAPYGLAGESGLSASLGALEKFRARAAGLPMEGEEGLALAALISGLEKKRGAIRDYNKVWSSYCGEVRGAGDIRLAPFHILATEGRVWSGAAHDLHLSLLEKYLRDLPNFVPTRNKIVDLQNEKDISGGLGFWEDLLADGAEGMVVKPLDFICRRGGALLQPALKCRGREYLRIIYGPEYLDNIDRLKGRALEPKRKRALKEFALGLDALELFAKGGPLNKVHERVFTILALESEPQDMRL